jgi:hypothetical protein
MIANVPLEMMDDGVLRYTSQNIIDPRVKRSRVLKTRQPVRNKRAKVDG